MVATPFPPIATVQPTTRIAFLLEIIGAGASRGTATTTLVIADYARPTNLATRHKVQCSAATVSPAVATRLTQGMTARSVKHQVPTQQAIVHVSQARFSYHSRRVPRPLAAPAIHTIPCYATPRRQPKRPSAAGSTAREETSCSQNRAGGVDLKMKIAVPTRTPHSHPQLPTLQRGATTIARLPSTFPATANARLPRPHPRHPRQHPTLPSLGFPYSTAAPPRRAWAVTKKEAVFPTAVAAPI